MRWPVMILVIAMLLGAAQPNLGPADPLAQLRALCAEAGSDGRWLGPGELKGALLSVVGEAAPPEVRAAIAKLGDRAHCFGLAFSLPPQPPLIVAGQERETAILWLENGTWQAGTSPEVILHPRILRIPAAWGGNEVILADEGHGSGQFGNLLVLRRLNATWVTAFKTPPIGRFRAYAPGDDHLLVTGGGGGPRGAPLAWTGNCCLPSNRQQLYVRKEPSFVLAAERDVPDPYTTLNIFFGALQADQPEYAAYWLGEVATKGAVMQARRLGLERADLVPGAGNPLYDVFRQEERHWNALPPKLNGPAPTPPSLKVLVDPPCAELALQRQAAGWRVVTVRTAGEAEACRRKESIGSRDRSKTSSAAHPSDARTYRN